MLHLDFPTKPIGGGNPYHCCSHCGRSVPEINGRLDKHEANCAYRLAKEQELQAGAPAKRLGGRSRNNPS